jgi:glycosyltransferase A (GT-A) superfamily protein (DUF2064 family)
MVMAKAPVAGQVKTRLCPPCSFEDAALVASAALLDTLDAVAACRAERKVIALAGEPGPWLPPGFDVIAQRGDTFDERLANAWADAGAGGLQIGMDTPQVMADELDELLLQLDRPGRVGVLGHARDGGWWVIGLSHLDDVFRDVPMSTPVTGARQEQRLRSLGFDVVRAGVHRDIDTVDDLVAVAAQAPRSRTAAVVRRLELTEKVA